MSSIFGGGGGATQPQNPPPGTGLFGSGGSTNHASAGGGLFGSTNNPPAPTASLFGGSTTQNPSTGTGTSLFGGSTAVPSQTQGTSLFGGAPAQNQPTGTGLFGSAAPASNQPPNTGNSIFGGNQAATNTTNTSTSLFSGAPAMNTTAQQSSLFNQPGLNQSTSLFAPASSNRAFGTSTNTAPHQTHLSTLLQSGLGGHPSSTYGALGSVSQQDLARSRLAAANINSRPNEKSVVDQIQTLVRKWDPNSADTLMQSYLYNAVNPAYAPFYYRNADENEESWEAALAAKPANMSADGTAAGGGGGDVAFIPILVRGFRALGDRVEFQARTLNEMRARLHEMNNSLDAVLRRHEQSLTLRVENARRQHAVLSQRCLRLAVKAQVLRHKNYPLDAAEEALRKTLLELEKQVFDPSFQAREEEIWARMVVLRERARWLEEEGKRLGVQVEEQRADGGSGVSDEVLQKTKRILKDYDGQLAHLAKELEEIKGQFDEWEHAR